MAVFIILIIIIGVIFYYYCPNETIKWTSAILFLGFLFGIVQLRSLPWSILSIFDTFVTYTFPFCYLMLSLSYTKSKKIQSTLLPYILFIPTLVFYLIDPTGKVFADYLFKGITDYNYFLVMFIWAGVYIVTGLFVQIRLLLREKIPQIRYEIVKCIIVFAPVALVGLIIGYFSPLYFTKSICGVQIYLLVFIVSVIALIVIFFGYNGIKIKIETYSRESTRKSWHLGSSIILHALKNQIQNVSICTEIIEKNPDKEKLKEVAATIKNALEQMLSTLRNIQDHTKEVETIKARVHLNVIFEEIFIWLNPIASDKNIMIYFECPDVLIIYGDKIQLKEVFVNIFNNAIDAIITNGSINIKAGKHKASVLIVITDNGTGISKENSSHVFDLFYSTKTEGQNYGLGLYYCRDIISRHGGEIWIQSELNKGTSVYIELPLI